MQIHQRKNLHATRTQVVQQTKSLQLVLVGMRSCSGAVAIQQPAQILLQVCVVNARVVEAQGLPAKAVRGVDEETHRPLQNGHAGRTRHPLDDHVLFHAAQTVKGEAVSLEDKSRRWECVLRKSF